MFFLSLTSALCLIMALGVNSSIQDRVHFSAPPDIVKIERGFRIALQHSNDAIVESAIFNAIHAQQLYPELRFPHILEALEYLSQHGRTPSICGKAALARAYLAAPDLFVLQDAIDHEYPERAFTAIELQLPELNYSHREG